MTSTVLLDTGPLVAFLNRREQHHEWARREFGSVSPPLLTCEAVLTEACWLVRGISGGAGAVMDLVGRGVVKAPFRLDTDAGRVHRLMERYRNLRMSLADACLVRMAEVHAGAKVMTLDAHFRVYRLSSRCVVPVIMPD